jgi:hypothetical protein
VTGERPRPDRFDAAVAIAALAGGAWLVLLGRGLTFFWDEWEFIQARSLTDVSTWFVPHGEHWTTLPALLYRVVVEIAGLRTYVPYHAVLIALHLLVVATVYVLVRRTTGPWLAVLAAVLVLLFGSGFEDLFWAFQYGFVACTGLALAALILLDGAPTPLRAPLLAIVVVAALMSSGLGLAVLAIVAVELLLRAPWRRHFWIALLGAAVYAAWFVAIGRVNVGSQGNPFTAQALLNIPATIVDGFGGAVGGVFGVGPRLGPLVAVALLIFVAWRARQGALSPRVVAIGAGLVLLYAIVGLARPEHPGGGAPRLVYFAGPLIIVALGELVGRPGIPQTRRARLMAVAAAAPLVALTFVWNIALLLHGRDLFAQRADITRALVELELDPPPGVTFDRTKPQIIMPSADVLANVVARYGSPLHDALADVPPPSAEARAKASAYLFDSGPIPVP